MTIRSLRTAAAPALILLAASATATALAAATTGATFLPGVYETTTSFADGTRETSRFCATSKGAGNDTLEARLAAMSRDPNCKFTKRSIAARKYAIAASCSNEGVTSSYSQSGTYSPTSMTMDMAMTMQAAPGQTPTSMRFRALSRRVAATCPAGMTEE